MNKNKCEHDCELIQVFDSDNKIKEIPYCQLYNKCYKEKKERKEENG